MEPYAQIFTPSQTSSGVKLCPVFTPEWMHVLFHLLQRVLYVTAAHFQTVTGRHLSIETRTTHVQRISILFWVVTVFMSEKLKLRIKLISDGHLVLFGGCCKRLCSCD